MSISSRAAVITAEELLTMPDEDARIELVRGEIVHEPPGGYDHGWFVIQLGSELLTHVERHSLGSVCGEAGFVLARDPDTVRAPDVSFIARGRQLPRNRGYFEGAPDVAFEILSPGNRYGETRDKVGEYLAAGAQAVVIVDPERQCAIVHRAGSEPRILAASDVFALEDVLPGFALPLAKLFRDRG